MEFLYWTNPLKMFKNFFTRTIHRNKNHHPDNSGGNQDKSRTIPKYKIDFTEYTPDPEIPFYENHREHLNDELKRINLIVYLYLEKWRKDIPNDAYGLQGLCVTEDEVDAILRNSHYREYVISDSAHEKIRKITQDISKKENESLKRGKELRLNKLSRLFNLQPFEVDILLICLAPEMDLKNEILYSYLQNDVTRKSPSVDLIIKLLYFIKEQFYPREVFSLASSLNKNHLVHLYGDDQIPILSKTVKVNERIIDYLLGYNNIDQEIQDYSYIRDPEESLKKIILTDNTRNASTKLIRQHSNVPNSMFYFYGPYGTGKKQMVTIICTQLDIPKPLLVVDSKALIKDESFIALDIILREAKLQDSLLYLKRFDVLLNQENSEENIRKILTKLDEFDNWIFISGEIVWEPPEVFEKYKFISLAFPLPSLEERKKLWKDLLDDMISNDVDIDALATKFVFV